VEQESKIGSSLPNKSQFFLGVCAWVCEPCVLQLKSKNTQKQQHCQLQMWDTQVFVVPAANLEIFSKSFTGTSCLKKEIK